MRANDNKRSPYVISLCQQKGGVGKTTTAACLAAELASQGIKCLLIDLAPSANLTTAFGFIDKEFIKTSADLFKTSATYKNLVQPTVISNLSLIPASQKLAPIPRELYNKPHYEQILKDILFHGDFAEFEILIVDCPPGLDSLTFNAIACANLVIIPLSCEVFSLHTLGSMFDLIDFCRGKINPNLAYRMLINKAVPGSQLHKQLYKQIQMHYQEALFETCIEFDNQIPESQLFRIPLTIYHSQAKARKQFQELANELLEILERNDKYNIQKEKEVK